MALIFFSLFFFFFNPKKKNGEKKKSFRAFLYLSSESSSPSLALFFMYQQLTNLPLPSPLTHLPAQKLKKEYFLQFDRVNSQTDSFKWTENDSTVTLIDQGKFLK